MKKKRITLAEGRKATKVKDHRHDPRLEKLHSAVFAAGGAMQVKNAIGCTYQSVLRWLTAGLPRTEYTGETHYAYAICREASLKGKFFTVEELLEENRLFLIDLLRDQKHQEVNRRTAGKDEPKARGRKKQRHSDANGLTL